MFSAAYKLRDSPDLTPHVHDELGNCLEWFEKHLPIPKRFNRTTSKGHYRRNTRGIAWFRDSAAECIARMHQLKRILEAHGYFVAMIIEERIGCVVYEDDVQVVAEPFSETKTGAS